MSSPQTLTPEEQRYDAHWPLHALARDYAEGSTRDDAVWLARFQALIEAGHSVNERCEHGLTPFDLLQPPGNALWTLSPQAARLLVEHGFNPLLKSPQNDIPYITSVLLGAGDNTVYDEMGMAIINALVRLEKQTPMRDETGGNLLHILCGQEDSLGLLPWILEHHSAVPGESWISLPTEWWHAPNASGQRPLDLMWGVGGKWDTMLCATDEADRETQMSMILDATGCIWTAGVDILTPNQHGISLAHVIKQRIFQEGDALDQLEGSPFLAWLQAWALNNETPLAPKRPTLGPRL